MGNVGKTVGMMGEEPSPATQKRIAATQKDITAS